MNNSTNVSLERYGYDFYCDNLPFIESEGSDNVPYLVTVLLLFSAGFIGNTITAAVISCTRKLHTPTFTMIACLAVSDAYSLLSHTLSTFTNINEIITCKYFMEVEDNEYYWAPFDTFIYFGRLNAGIQLCVLACLRFIAIVYPLKFKTHCTCRAVILMSVVLSVLCLIISLIVKILIIEIAIFSKNHYAVILVKNVFNFIIPTSVFTVFHCLKLRALRRSPSLTNNFSLKMNVVITIVLSIYVTSSASLVILDIIIFYTPYEIHIFYLITDISFVVNCAANPFIYFFSSPAAVQMFRNISHQLCYRWQITISKT